MSNNYFLTQEATNEILLRVTNVCGECYSDLKEKDIIYYDMQTYRYLCSSCKEGVCEVYEKESEEYEDITQALF